jgi:hypothetical protein
MEEEYLEDTPDPFNLGEGYVVQKKQEKDPITGKYIVKLTGNERMTGLKAKVIKLYKERRKYGFAKKYVY